MSATIENEEMERCHLKPMMAPASELTPGYRSDLLREQIAKLAAEFASPKKASSYEIFKALLEIALAADRYLAEQTDKEPLL